MIVAQGTGKCQHFVSVICVIRTMPNTISDVKCQV